VGRTLRSDAFDFDLDLDAGANLKREQNAALTKHPTSVHPVVQDLFLDLQSAVYTGKNSD
jgi:hypothetical protein